MDTAIGYPVWNTVPIKCGSAKCGWTGMESDLRDVPEPGPLKITRQVCPRCGCAKYSFVKTKKKTA